MERSIRKLALVGALPELVTGGQGIPAGTSAKFLPRREGAHLTIDPVGRKGKFRQLAPFLAVSTESCQDSFGKWSVAVLCRRSHTIFGHICSHFKTGLKAHIKQNLNKISYIHPICPGVRRVDYASGSCRASAGQQAPFVVNNS